MRPDTGTSRHCTWGALLAAVLLGLTLVLASSRGGLQHSSLLVMAIDRGSAAVNSTGAALLGLADSLAAKAAAARAAAAASAAGGSEPHATAADRAEAERGEIPDGPEVQGLPCQESGYCSVGKLRPYVGRMDSTEEFQAMLNASCYKKECIFVTIGSGGHLLGLNLGEQQPAWLVVVAAGFVVVGTLPRLGPSARVTQWCMHASAMCVAQCLRLRHSQACRPPPLLRKLCNLHGPHPCLPAVSSAWRLGLANILFHAKTNESCAVLAKAGYTNVGWMAQNCVWFRVAPAFLLSSAWWCRSLPCSEGWTPSDSSDPQVTCVWSEFDWFPHKNHQYGVHEAGAAVACTWMCG